ncbi:hypothetical protein [Streptosporangium saharense]
MTTRSRRSPGSTRAGVRHGHRGLPNVTLSLDRDRGVAEAVAGRLRPA